MPNRLIAFLGNPGQDYRRTRHNAGAAVFDAGCERRGWSPSTRFTGLLVVGGGCLFFRPLTFMNKSGDPVSRALAFYKLPPASLVVVHDDTELPFGKVQYRSGGGLAGHNGLRSIKDRIGTPEFHRIRIGIGRPAHGTLQSHVLGRFSPDEAAQLGSVVDTVLALVDDLCTE